MRRGAGKRTRSVYFAAAAIFASMSFTVSLPWRTAVSSLFATSVQTWRKSTWFPQPCVNCGYFTKAPRPATGLTSLRAGNAKPSEVHFYAPVLPVSQLSSVQAAALFLESFAIEYAFVNARFPRVLPLGIGASV
jgi:hypothetical protein